MINHFSRIIIFVWFFGSTFPICLTILSMPIPIVFLSGFLTWESHSHFVRVKYTIGGPIGRNVVWSNSSSRSLSYSNSPPYLCFPFVDKWYTYSRSYIRCGSCFFTIRAGIFSIKAFNTSIEMCSLVFTGVRPLYITSLLLTQVFVFWAHQWDPNYSLSHLWRGFS